MSINDYTKAEGVSQLPSDETEKQAVKQQKP